MADEQVGEVATLETSPFGQCLNSTVRVLGALNLGVITSSDPQRFHIRKIPLFDPNTDNIVTPAILVCQFPESYEDTFNNRVDVTYRVLVVLFKSGNRGLIDGLADQLQWRNQIMMAFTRKQSQMTTVLVDDAQVLRVFPEPGEPIIPESWRANYDAQWIIVNYLCRQPRLET